MLFKDVYPWDAIDDTPFGASYAIVTGGGRTMLHSHDPAETFFICKGTGTIAISGRSESVGPGDVIYLPPHSEHDLTNASATEDLVFVSVFWKARIEAQIDPTPRLLMPSPPTPNGPLHLGHLAGPYLLGDVMRRYYRMHGVPATLVCVTDDHQSFVAERGDVEGRSAADHAQMFSAKIAEALQRFHAQPDATLGTSVDEALATAVRARFAELRAAGKIEVREVETLYCETCDRGLYDSYLHGTCPHCGANSSGFVCESCNVPSDTAAIVGPTCTKCDQPASRRTMLRALFPIAPYKDALAEYHRRLRLAPKLRKLAVGFLATDFALEVSQPGTWGLALDGDLAGQVISPWFELSLAASHVRETHAPSARLTVYFGVDNAYLYLIQDPAVAIALGREGDMAAELAANEFLLLDDAKMSTSRAHGIDAIAVLTRAPADLVRLYLAKIRPEDSKMTSGVQAAQVFLTMVARFWQMWLLRLGLAIEGEFEGRSPQPANPSLVPWPQEQRDFLASLEALIARARRGYDASSLKEPSTVIHELVERAVAFGAAQAALAHAPSLAAQRATGLALELAAARTLAMIVAPVMPLFAQQLWAALGMDEANGWYDDVPPFPAGQRITLGTTRFFPDSIVLA